MYERIKHLRKNVLHLTQEEFSSSIKISRSNLGSIETGRINITDRLISDICEKYSVSEKWLRTGKGEIFETFENEDEYMKAATELKLDGDKLAMQAVIKYWRMPKEQKEAFKNYILSIAEACKEEE